jgi:hypothetical protein
MKASKPNISARGNVAVYSSAARTYVRNSVTRAHAAHVAKPSSTRSVVAVDVPSCTRLCRAVPNHHLVDTLVNARKHVVTLRYPTTATKTMRLVPNAHSLWRNVACAGRRPSRISSAGCKMFAVAISVVTSFVVDRTSAVSLAIDPESAKMQMAKLARSPAASPRRRAAIRMRTCAMLHSLARRRSHVKVRSSSRATAKRRSRI